MNDFDQATLKQFAARFARIEAMVPEPPVLHAGVVPRPRIAGPIVRAAVLVGVVILLAAAIGLAAIGSRPAPKQYTLSTYPDAKVTCEADPGWALSGLTDDPCPAAIAAAVRATGTIQVRIVRITIRPGPFGDCGDVWSTATPAPSCLHQPSVLPRLVMHAWVGFADTQRVLPVYLWRPTLQGTDVPLVDPSGGIFWNFTWAGPGYAWQIPPDGWVFP